MKLTGQDIADQFRSRAEDARVLIVMTEQVRHYFHPNADARYNTKAIAADLIARGVGAVAEVGSGPLMGTLAYKHKR